MGMKFSKATKFNSFLKLGLAGPPGSGKSYSALSIATALSEKRVAVIDAELGAASKYASMFDFDVLELTLDENGREIDKPFNPVRYIEAIKAAYDSGEYDVLIIDGISPEWDDAGGCLQWVDQITRNNNTRDAWKVVTPVHKKFINTILRVRMHVICTMLAKKEIVVDKDAQGRPMGKKVTLEPVQRVDVPQVFDVFALMQNKDMIIDKTRCSALDDQVYHKPGKEVADILHEWLKGEPLPERPEYGEPEPEQNTKPIVPNPEGQNAPMTDQQGASLKKLCTHLEKPFPAEWSTLSYIDAKARITQLSHEYNERKQGHTSKEGEEPLPSKKDLYEAGKSKNMWNKPEEFYAACSVILEASINAANWDTLKREQVMQLAQHIEETEALSLSA